MSDNKIVKAIKDSTANMEGEMSFFDHLEALRWHLIRASIAVVVIIALVFSFYDWIFTNIIMGPAKPGFFTYRAICKIGEWLHRPGMCVDKIDIQLINTEMAGQFTLQINSSLIIGLTLGFPYLLWELWQFIKPALHEKERKAASGFVFYASFLFLLGVGFGYYVISPMSLKFLSGYEVSSSIKNLFTTDSYLSSVSTLTLATGIVFEMPILIYVLANLGIMTAALMRKSRRYAVVVILIIAAIVTPTPDMLTMTVVSIPLFLLYEISIWVAALVGKRKLKRELETA